MTRYASRWAAMIAAGALALTLAACEAPTEDAASTDSSGLAGTYTTKDTQGNDMTVTLDDEGSATGKRADQDLSGSWKVEGNTAVIDWQDGWFTKIAKDGDTYSKTAFEGDEEKGSAVPAQKTQ